MKIIIKPKCADCGESNPRQLLRCNNVMDPGCENFYCYLDWPNHFNAHDVENGKEQDDQ